MRLLNHAILGFAALAHSLCAVAAIQADESRLQKYLRIAEREPFGEMVPPEEGSAESSSADAGAKSLSENLELRAIVDDGLTLRVGFLDKQQQKKISLSLGETVDGLELVSVDYDDESCVLRRGRETSFFSLKPEGAAAREKAAAESAPAPAKLASRRRPVFSNMAKHPAPGAITGGFQPTPYRGKTIEDFLRDHPDAALKYPSPLRPAQSSTLTQDRGETIERFLRENPDAVRKFSPFQTFTPPTNAEGRGEIIERFMNEHSVGAAIPSPQPAIQAPEVAPFLFEEIPEDEYYYE